MRLKPEESKKLANHTINLLMDEKSATLKATRAQLLEAVERALVQHFEQERQIEEQAQKLFTEKSAAFPQMERGKAIFMIKKQLAKEKKFILSGDSNARFSEDKIYHIAHLVSDKIYNDDLVDFPSEEGGVRFIKKVFVNYFGRENEVDQKVRKKLNSLSKVPFEGSREWETLYKKYWEEEMRRIGHA